VTVLCNVSGKSQRKGYHKTEHADGTTVQRVFTCETAILLFRLGVLSITIEKRIKKKRQAIKM